MIQTILTLKEKDRVIKLQYAFFSGKNANFAFLCYST